VALVVMTTHGRTGAKRVALDRVARSVLPQGHRPLVLVRPQAMGERQEAEAE
jgi:nucleotide-binding universal stress UspA family protein